MGQILNRKQLTPEEQEAYEKENAEIQKKMDKLFEEELEKTSQPMFLTKAFVNKPFHVLGVISIFFIIGIILTATASLFKLSEDHDRDYLIWSNERTKDWDIYEEIKLDFQKSQSNSQTPERSVSMDDWFTFIIITCEDDDCGNMITPAAVELMYKTEERYRNHKDYEKFCLASTTSTDCAGDSFFSITKSESDFPDPNNVTKAQIDAFIDRILNDDDAWLQYKGFFHEELSRNNKRAKAMRSMLRFGAPIKVNGKLKKDIFEDEDAQQDEFEELCRDYIDIFRDEIKTTGNLQVIGWSGIIRELEQQRIVNTDFLWAFGSIAFVWFYITFTLKSLFLGSLSIFSIVMSFPLTQIIVKLIFQIKYFSSLHILVVFIVLGISADNVFVFTDAWNQSEFYKSLEGDYDKRMAVTFRRASKAILATSSTTGAAFLATGLSTIMPISSFGFFAGVLIPINFILVITFYPVLLMIYTKYTKNMCTMASCRKTSTEKQVEDKEKQSEDKEKQQPAEGEQKKKDELTMNQKIEKFFAGPFDEFTNRFSIPIIIIFAIWTSLATWRTAKLPGLSKPMAFLPDDFDTQKASNLLREEFHTSGDTDNGIKVYQYWGAKSISQDDVGTWDSSDRGKVNYDNTFTLAPPDNQEFLFNYCKQMRENTKLVQDKRVECFIDDFKEWADDNVTGGFPVPEEDFIKHLKDFVKDPIGEKHFIENSIGLIGDRLKYISIEIASVGTPFASYKILNPIYEDWDNHIKATNREAPEGMKKSKQTALINWVLMVTEKAFVSNAIQGTLISITFAFAVLILTTHNIVISCFSTLSIGGIILSVISIMEMNGWELGVAESIAIVILIGMSVDYVVHLANHYVESMFPDKHRKMQMSLKDLGISIISGAFTTIGSGIFLFFATMIIFNKFALLIVVTILFSLSYALIFFSALNHLIGPQGDTGNLLVLFRKKDKKGEDKSTEKSNEAPGSKNNLVNEEKQKYIDDQNQKQQSEQQGSAQQDQTAQANSDQQADQKPKGTEVEDIEQQ